MRRRRDDARVLGRLFAYGTLMMPAVFADVVGRSLPGHSAILSGFARYRVRGRTFPGIIEDRSRMTEGLVFTGLTPSDWQRLDAFEGDVYERRMVTVTVGRGRSVDAYTYVVVDRFRGILSDQPWDRERFCQRDLVEYLKRIGTR